MWVNLLRSTRIHFSNRWFSSHSWFNCCHSTLQNILLPVIIIDRRIRKEWSSLKGFNNSCTLRTYTKRVTYIPFLVLEEFHILYNHWLKNHEYKLQSLMKYWFHYTLFLLYLPVGVYCLVVETEVLNGVALNSVDQKAFVFVLHVYLLIWWLFFFSRYMGTVTGISNFDQVRWPNSHWRSVKVSINIFLHGSHSRWILLFGMDNIVFYFIMHV